jgi:hypothetical protein
MTNMTPPPKGRRLRRSRTARIDPGLLAVAPEWLTREQAARIANVTPRTIDRWRGDGLLTTYRTESGRAHRPVLVKRDDVAKALEVAPEATS